MARYDRQQVTIGQWMVTIAVMGLLIAVLANPGAARGASVAVGFTGAGEDSSHGRYLRASWRSFRLGGRGGNGIPELLGGCREV